MEPKRQTSSTVSGDNMDSVAELWPSTRGSPAVSEGEGEAGGALLFSRCGSGFHHRHSSTVGRGTVADRASARRRRLLRESG